MRPQSASITRRRSVAPRSSRFPARGCSRLSGHTHYVVLEQGRCANICFFPQSENRPHTLHFVPAVTRTSMFRILQALPRSRCCHKEHHRLLPHRESDVRCPIAVVVALWLMYCLKPSSTYMRADSGGGVDTADYPNHAASSGTSIFSARFNRGRGRGYLRCRRIRSR